MNTYIEKAYIQCLKETVDIDVTNLDIIEKLAIDKLKTQCKIDQNLLLDIKTTYKSNTDNQIHIFHILCKLYTLHDILFKSETILNNFIMCLRNYHLYNIIVIGRELPCLSQIIKSLETGMSKEIIIDSFNKFLTGGNMEDYKIISQLVCRSFLTFQNAEVI